MSSTLWQPADLTQIRALVRERNALARDLQMLRAAAIALHATLNTFWQQDCDRATVIRAQSHLVDTLSSLSSSVTERMECL